MDEIEITDDFSQYSTIDLVYLQAEVDLMMSRTDGAEKSKWKKFSADIDAEIDERMTIVHDNIE